ncbi:LmbU family transcriptional regulator [Streptomyces armeniacus]|uniref:LmbU family transcriptional regulator n=1 Tax=Streptomyces armeniacus TaxID=83291 RepID=UPI001AD82E11|nr:LmbU family transcriptional regulator [Streptomyces armeniacus]
MDAATETQVAKDTRPKKPLPLLPEQRRAASARHPGRSQVLTTGVGLQMPAELTFEDWQRAGLQISGLINSSVWWLGDWLVYGKDHFADRYQRGVRAAGLQYQTLRNYAWVSRRFELHRRRPQLSFQHHAEVASLPVPEQEWWLDRAEQQNWSTKQLRNSIRDAQGEKDPDGKPESEIQRLPVPGNRLSHWRRAAEQAGVDLNKWVLATLDRAARRTLEEAEPAAAGAENDRTRARELSVR